MYIVKLYKFKAFLYNDNIILKRVSDLNMPTTNNEFKESLRIRCGDWEGIIKYIDNKEPERLKGFFKKN